MARGRLLPHLASVCDGLANDVPCCSLPRSRLRCSHSACPRGGGRCREPVHRLADDDTRLAVVELLVAPASDEADAPVNGIHGEACVARRRHSPDFADLLLPEGCDSLLEGLQHGLAEHQHQQTQDEPRRRRRVQGTADQRTNEKIGAHHQHEGVVYHGLLPERVPLAQVVDQRRRGAPRQACLRQTCGLPDCEAEDRHQQRHVEAATANACA
mmetsp:Transcript_89093/g.276894  ORF Transcript_89093/g.276894 Transcript_89093/m.276894 type:complete len:213 (+) Transcript_89093:963-1601(+)